MPKTFDQYLAESGQQSTADALRRSGQYGQAESQYNSTGSYNPNGGSSSGGNGNFNDILSSSIQQFKQANQPIVDSLNSSIPTLQKGFETQRQNLEAQRGTLKDQYDTLISGLKNQQTQGVNRQTVATNNELGKRGIVGSSGVAQQEIINATEPINQNYSNLIAQTGNQGAQAQQQITQQQGQLTTDEANALQNVQNAIAQYQSTGNINALQAAQAQYQAAQQQAQFEKNYALQQAQQQQAAQLALQQFNQISLPTAQAQIKDINSQIASRNKTSNTSANEAKLLQQIFGGNTGASTQSSRPPLSSFG